MTPVVPRPTAGFRLGILTLDTCHALVRGNVQHAESFSFAVEYQVVADVPIEALMRGDPAALPAIVQAAQALEARGVEVIVGACGSFANFQRNVADALSVPAFMSILLEVPLILRSLPRHRHLGIIFARAESFTARVREQCGIADSPRIVSLEAAELPAFKAILEQRGSLESEALERELVELTLRTLKQQPAIGAWLLQCSDLPPYSASIQRATGLPVFDMVALIEHLGATLRPQEFS
jgi:Asp/Glu/hydantoin racemase